MKLPKFRLLAMASLFLAMMIVEACGGNGTAEVSQPTKTPASETSAALSKSSLEAFVASTDLSVGLNRVAFALIDKQIGPLRVSDVQVSTYFLTDAGPEGPKEVQPGIYRAWPNIPGGLYTTHLAFDKPGAWELDIGFAEEGGSLTREAVQIEVKEKSATTALGAPAVRSKNKTARDVETLEELTTALSPDPDLYRMTIAEAIDSGKPLMVVFSTPAFCETATCGPQLEVVEELKDRYKDRANFIHVEVYDNPGEMQGDLSKGRISPTITEWNLPSEPWTFVVDSEGLVSAKFEGFAPKEEVEPALVSVLE